MSPLHSYIIIDSSSPSFHPPGPPPDAAESSAQGGEGSEELKALGRHSGGAATFRPGGTAAGAGARQVPGPGSLEILVSGWHGAGSERACAQLNEGIS